MIATFSTFCGMIVSETRDGVERDYMPDTLGSTAALLDENQEMTDTWEYYPYGEVAARTGTHETDLTFVGMLGYFKDILDKLLYVRARHFRPELGIWQTVDPLWPEEPPFAYCSSKPASCTDKSGTKGYADCLKDALIDSGIGCLAGLIISAGCSACLAAGIAICGWFPPSCVALSELCTLVCGSGLVKCIVGAIFAVLLALIKCAKPTDPGIEPGGLEDCWERCRIYRRGRAHMECMRNCRTPRRSIVRRVAGPLRACQGRI